MWSFSFAGSIRSSTAAIGRAVGEGDGLAVRVAVGDGVVDGSAATVGVGLATVSGPAAPPQDAATIARSRAPPAIRTRSHNAKIAQTVQS
jgi:hypothetical protein